MLSSNETKEISFFFQIKCGISPVWENTKHTGESKDLPSFMKSSRGPDFRWHLPFSQKAPNSNFIYLHVNFWDVWSHGDEASARWEIFRFSAVHKSSSQSRKWALLPDATMIFNQCLIAPRFVKCLSRGVRRKWNMENSGVSTDC